LDADQAAEVIASAKGDRPEALAMLVLVVGLHHGEASDCGSHRRRRQSVLGSADR
jgi:hypothetical protein